eukprot:SAG31_NODE_14607_length_796_cov_2.373027_1_plen_132_part_00
MSASSQGGEAAAIRAQARREQWTAQRIAELTVNLLLGEHISISALPLPDPSVALRSRVSSRTRTPNATRRAAGPAPAPALTAASGASNEPRANGGLASRKSLDMRRSDPELELVYAWKQFTEVAKGHTIRA